MLGGTSGSHSEAPDEARDSRRARLDFQQRLLRQTMVWKEHEKRKDQKRPALKDRQKDADDADDREDNGERQADEGHLRGSRSARYARGIFWNSVTPSLES